MGNEEFKVYETWDDMPKVGDIPAVGLIIYLSPSEEELAFQLIKLAQHQQYCLKELLDNLSMLLERDRKLVFDMFRCIPKDHPWRIERDMEALRQYSKVTGEMPEMSKEERERLFRRI